MDNKYILTPNGELYHWGIKGMKWGVRRFQNPDGSLTAAGQKRYDDKLSKIEAKTAKLRAKQEAKAAVQARKDKLAAAKQDLENAKKGKKSPEKEAEKAAEDDAAKKERLLKSPNAKEVYENRHLFTNNEVQQLQQRLQNESNIKNLIPKDVDVGKAKMDKIMAKVGDMTDYAVKGAKAWNMLANVVNALPGTDVPLPKIDTKIDSGNKEQRKKALEKKNEAEEAKVKKEADAKQAKSDKKAELAYQKWERKQDRKEAKQDAKEAERKAKREAREEEREAKQEARQAAREAAKERRSVEREAKRVERLLEQMDRATVKESKHYEKRVEKALETIDDIGWSTYYDMVGHGD